MIHLPVGSLINAAAIVAGGFLGVLLHGRFPDRVKTIVFQALGLSVLILGIQMALTMQKPLLVIFSLLIGGIVGELCCLEDQFTRLGEVVKTKLKSRNPRFTEGLVTASLIFCVGSMAILGAFDEGLRHDPSILLTKSLLDGFASIALGASFGAGVAVSAVPVFVYQFGLSLFAGLFRSLLSPEVIGHLTATGGVMIMAIGINLLELKYIKISNFLPGLPVAVLLGLLFG